MVSYNLPNEHRFLVENVYDDCIEPEISVRSCGAFHMDMEFVIRHKVNGKIVTEYAPVKEVEGMPLPMNDGLYNNHYYKFGQSEEILKSFYSQQNH